MHNRPKDSNKNAGRTSFTAMDDEKSESVFVQVALASAPHAKNCEVLRFSEEKLWTCGADGRLACSSYEGGAECFNFHRFESLDHVFGIFLVAVCISFPRRFVSYQERPWVETGHKGSPSSPPRHPLPQ